jgi:EPS-associated MarR family transcriptional regulator
MIDVHYKMMRLLEAHPEMSQRQLARHLGMSLGKVNYCLQALIAKGWIKANNFTNSQNKAGYMYLLTPRGLDEKARLTVRFLQIKMREYEVLRAEIRQIRREMAENGAAMDEAGQDSRKGRNGTMPPAIGEDGQR